MSITIKNKLLVIEATENKSLEEMPKYVSLLITI